MSDQDHVAKFVTSATAGELLLSRIAFNQLTITYKSLVDERRIDWKRLDKNNHLSMIEYKRQLAHEIIDLCREFHAIIDKHLLPSLKSPQDKAHAHKLKADLYRYTYEVSEGSLKEWSAAKACRSYQRGYDTIRRAQCLSPLDPVRFDLAVNFTVCLKHIFGVDRAVTFVRCVLDDTPPISNLTEGPESLRDLRDYLTNLSDCSHNHRAHDNDDAVDLSSGFCTSDSSDTEPEQ